MRGYVKDWGRRGNVKECGTYTIIDCREWQKEQWDNERWQRGAEARRLEREQSLEKRRHWRRRRTSRHSMKAEDIDAPGPTTRKADNGAVPWSEVLPCHICKVYLCGRNPYEDHLKSNRHRLKDDAARL